LGVSVSDRLWQETQPESLQQGIPLPGRSTIDALLSRLAALFGRHRLILACFVVTATTFAVVGVTRVTFDNDPLKMLRSDKTEFKQLTEDFAALERFNLVVVEGHDLLTPEGVRTIRKIVDKVAALDGVQSVYSMLNLRDNRRVGSYLLPLIPSADAPEDRFRRARLRSASHPLLVGHFLSEDRKTSLVIVELDEQIRDFFDLKSGLRQLKHVLRETTAGTGFRARVTGTPALQVEIVQSMRRDIFSFSTLGTLVAIVIAVVLFRRMAAVFLVAIGPIVGTVWTVGALGLIGEPINILTNVVPVLVMIIGFTNSMHLVLHIRRSASMGASGLEAATNAIRDLGFPCALTSLSTAVGFGSLLLASLDGIQTFGRCCALGSVLSLLAVVTVVPLVASTGLSRYTVLRRPSAGRRRVAVLANRGLDTIVAHSRFVLGGGVAVTILLAALTQRLESDHTLSMEIPRTNDVYQTLAHVDETFGGVMLAYAVVDWPEPSGLRSPEFYRLLREVHDVFDASPVFSNPLSILNLVEALPSDDGNLSRRARELRYVPDDQLRRFISFQKHRALVCAHMPDTGARLLTSAFGELESQFEEIQRRHPGFRIELTGEAVTMFKNIHLMIEDLWRSLLTAGSVMFLMIWLGLRSFHYALVSVIPNVFPLLCTGAFILLSGRCLEMSSVIVFSIALGIAVDDTIHFLVRYQRELQSTRDPPEAVGRTFRIVGRALVMTTVALVAGHGIVMMSAFEAVRVFGMLSAVALASALVGDLVILPALLVCFTRVRKPATMPDAAGSMPELQPQATADMRISVGQGAVTSRTD
jgi:predicted RND superfamily exporter protein